MSLDFLSLQAVVDECAAVEGSRIVAIDQIGSNEIAFTLKTAETRRALAISVQPDYARLFLMKPPKSSAGTSALLGSLRSHLLSGMLERIEAAPNERIAVLGCVCQTPEGARRYRLIAEMIGRHTMLAFVHDNEELTIIETLRRVKTGERELLPDEPYEFPRGPDKIPLTEVSKEILREILEAPAPEQLPRAMTKRVNGLSPVMAREVTAAAGLIDEAAFNRLDIEDRIERLWSEWTVLLTRVAMKEWEPALGLDEAGTPVILSPLPIASLPPGRIQRCASMSEAIDRYYAARIELEQRRQQEQRVRRTLTDEIERLDRLVENLERDLAVTEREDEFRKFGELLSAHIHELKPGQSEAVVTDYYHPEQPDIHIQLNPDLGPADNAQRYFKRAKKARDGREKIEQRLIRTRGRLKETRSCKAALEEAGDDYALDRAYRDCIRLGLIKGKKDARSAGRKKQNRMEIHPRRFVTTDGAIVLVGRNNKENDILTKTASPDDIWLHARDMGGSHVILRREGKKAMPSRQTCYEAAGVAAYFSKGRGSTTVPVDYTERRYVRKMKDGAPGQVIFTHEKTLFVEPKLLPEADTKEKDEI